MRIQAGDIQINYELEGDGPTVVLTHGLGSDVSGWQAASDALRDRYRVLRWDVRGFGLSDRPPGPMSPSVWAADLAALLDALEIEQAVIGGISMGGVVAQRFALDFPAKTRALVLVSTSSEVGEAARSGWEARASLVEEKGMAALLDQTGPAIAYSESYRSANADAIRRSTEEAVARNDPHCYAAAARGVSGYNYTPELRSIDCPTLILQGLEDGLTPPGGSVIMSRHIPDARLEMIERCGHGIPAEQPREMMRLLDDFLAGLP